MKLVIYIVVDFARVIHSMQTVI